MLKILFASLNYSGMILLLLLLLSLCRFCCCKHYCCCCCCCRKNIPVLFKIELYSSEFINFLNDNHYKNRIVKYNSQDEKISFTSVLLIIFLRFLNKYRNNNSLKYE